MVEHTKPIAESKHFIVLNKYTKEWEVAESYQSESDLERELVQDLDNQGYEFLPELTTPDAMLSNVRVQLQTLNNVQLADSEWHRFVETYLDKPSDSIADKTRKIHDDYIYDFGSNFSSGNINLVRRFGEIQYNDEHLSFTGIFSDDKLLSTPENPYSRLPQLRLSLLYPETATGFSTNL